MQIDASDASYACSLARGDQVKAASETRVSAFALPAGCEKGSSSSSAAPAKPHLVPRLAQLKH